MSMITKTKGERSEPRRSQDRKGEGAFNAHTRTEEEDQSREGGNEIVQGASAAKAERVSTKLMDGVGCTIKLG